MQSSVYLAENVSLTGASLVSYDAGSIQRLKQPILRGGVTMPFGGFDWLALTSEPTLELERPVC